MKPKRRRRSLKRKYKGLVAAVAGAAVLSSSLMPGMPVTRAHAAVIPKAAASPAAEQNVPAEAASLPETEQKAADELSSSPVEAARRAAAKHGFDASRDRFTLDWKGKNEASVRIRTEDGRNFKMQLTKEDNGDWSVIAIEELDRDYNNDRDRDTAPAGSPVRVVKDNAAAYGFDVYHDKFSLLSIAGTKAIVEVRTSGQTFKVDLVKRSGEWEITTIRGIGNMKYPATYTPASMFRYHSPVPAPIAIPAEQTTLFKTDDYKDWSWNQTLYPQSMRLGVAMHVSQLVGSAIFIPDSIKDQIKNVDLDRELVLFAHLGAVPSRGYGIAIEKVAQTGNSLIVTVAAKSPLDSEKLNSTKFDDYVLVNRSALDFSKPIQIIFIDRNGTPLANYTILPR